MTRVGRLADGTDEQGEAIGAAELGPQVRTMAAMQERHNRRVHPDWQRQGHAYYRAVWVECAELLDHYGWKWWKRQAADIAQVKLEVVDIWHFGLSELIRGGEAPERVASRLRTALARPAPADFRLAVEALAGASLQTRAFDLDAFAGVMRALPLGFNELYQTYVAKNVLNNFRQEHGYQKGRYRKLWDGREDNEHLVELMRGLDAAALDFPEVLANALAARYAIAGPGRAE